VSANIRRASKAGVPIVRAVERAIALLRAFSAEHPRQTLTELASATSLDKNTTRRLLHTLETGGLVEHRDGLYGLSYGLLELFSGVEAGGDLREIAMPILHQVARETSATTFLWIYREGLAVCVERTRPPHPKVEMTWSPIGSRTTLNSGGGPLALLGHLPLRERAVALEQVMISRTPLSLVDRRELEKRADDIARDGHVIAENDFIIGLTAVGVPVFDRSGNLAAALAISSLCDHTNALLEDGVVDRMKRYATAIGQRL
jgi:DNA-binding IclR family transcriptional regulator